MFHVPEQYRIKGISDNNDGNNGAFLVRGLGSGPDLSVIASDGEGWEHVSVSLRNRCPNWPEMCHIKSLFWNPEDCVIQIHAPMNEYVNNHPYCLHMWRPTDREIPRPPKELV